MHDEWVTRGAAFHVVDPLNGIRVIGAGGQPIDGLGRQNDQCPVEEGARGDIDVFGR